ncbi:MAG: dihydroorotate dehydrogenase [Candidatus Omnitrophica bacterium]|nr:dihydroorotate dehydrogenase [Candidatus Omnitrophota bacterium]
MGLNTLGVKIGGLSLNSPVIMMSGIFSYGEVVLDYLDYKKLGAIVTKTVSLEPRKGNPQPRVWEAPSGMLNSIGLQNPGIKAFIKKGLPAVRKNGIRIIVSVTGNSAEEISGIVNLLSAEKIDGIELNLSCPNVNRKELMAAQSPEMTWLLVKAAKKECGRIPLIAKLSPNVTDITAVAAAAEDAGADALSLINTVRGISVDVEKMRIMEGGLSGPAIKPAGLRAVYDVFRKTGVPLIGMGGIASGRDAVEYILAGASAVGVGSGFFSNPFLVDEIYRALGDFLKNNGIKKLSCASGLLNEKEKKQAGQPRRKRKV